VGFRVPEEYYQLFWALLKRNRLGVVLLELGLGYWG
jgi:hypothetical protein